MALALGFSAGQDFYVGDVRVKVHSIMGPRSFIVEVYSDPDKIGIRKFVNDAESTKITEQARISAGIGDTNNARVLIEAPREIRILRGDIYRREVLKEEVVNS